MVMYIGASFLCMLVEMYYGVTVSCLGECFFARLCLPVCICLSVYT